MQSLSDGLALSQTLSWLADNYLLVAHEIVVTIEFHTVKLTLFETEAQ